MISRYNLFTKIDYLVLFSIDNITILMGLAFISIKRTSVARSAAIFYNAAKYSVLALIILVVLIWYVREYNVSIPSIRLRQFLGMTQIRVVKSLLNLCLVAFLGSLIVFGLSLQHLSYRQTGLVILCNLVGNFLGVTYWGWEIKKHAK